MTNGFTVPINQCIWPNDSDLTRFWAPKGGFNSKGNRAPAVFREIKVFEMS